MTLKTGEIMVKIQLCIRNKYMLKLVLCCNNISKYYCFNCISDQKKQIGEKKRLVFKINEHF